MDNIACSTVDRSFREQKYSEKGKVFTECKTELIFTYLQEQEHPLLSVS